MLERRGGVSPHKLSGTGSVKKEGKGTSPNRGPPGRPGPGGGGRVLANGMCPAEPSAREIAKSAKSAFFTWKSEMGGK